MTSKNLTQYVMMDVFMKFNRRIDYSICSTLWLYQFNAKPNRQDTCICIALTFNLDLAWFETAVYQRLITAGVRRILIIADPAEFSASIERQGGSIHRAGIDYSIIGINVQGCFHPNAVFISGQNVARLYVM